MLQFQAQDKPIREILFSHDQFRIPEYQRPYSWGIDEASDFWHYLMESGSGYFLGSFVFNYENQKETKRVDIIDGQQRSLTITIFIAVIRDCFKVIDLLDISDNIQREFIAKPDFLGSEMNYRIIPGESCKDFFSKYIQSDSNNLYTLDISKKLYKTKEERNIIEVYKFFLEQITQELSMQKGDMKKSYLGGLLNKILDLRAIWIKIENEVDAYTIFETVNARGIDLSVSDLVKNLVFKHYEKKYGKLDNAKSLRNEIEQNISESGQELSKFLRHYRNSKYKYITEKDLFKEIKNEIHDYESFLKEACQHSNWYKIIMNPQDYTVDDLMLNTVAGKESVPLHIYQSLIGISIIKIKQYSTVLLSIFRNFDLLIKTANPRTIIENMEKFGYVYYGICSLPSKQVEVAGSDFAIQLEKECSNGNHAKISDNIQTRYNKYKEFMKKYFPTYDEFKNSFNDLSYKKRELTKYTLMKISNQLEVLNTQDDLFDYSKISIEHILPQEPKERGLTKKSVEKYVNKIGNLTLLGKKMNSKVGNSILKEKTENNEYGFNLANITMTKKLINVFRENNYVWGEEEINKRHEELGRTIYDIQKVI